MRSPACPRTAAPRDQGGGDKIPVSGRRQRKRAPGNLVSILRWIEYRNIHGRKVRNIAGNESQVIDQGGRSYQCITLRPFVWYVEFSTAQSNRLRDRQYASTDIRPEYAVQPDSQLRSLGEIPTFLAITPCATSSNVMTEMNCRLRGIEAAQAITF